ncbi:hypothetical protein HYT55_05510 [Candidatus Woesearchaeota archaeon]|nr:hypothetical protein [Candidatus Woesearchaeota archaeon]
MTLTIEEQVKHALAFAQEGRIGNMKTLLDSIDRQLGLLGRKTYVTHEILLEGYKRSVDTMLDEMTEFAYEGRAIEDFLIETFIKIAEEYIKLKYDIDFEKVPENGHSTTHQESSILAPKIRRKKGRNKRRIGLEYGSEVIAKLHRIVKISYENGLCKHLQKAEAYALQDDRRVNDELLSANKLAQRLNRDIGREVDQIRITYAFFST